MGWYVCVGALAAFGLICAGWSVLGFWLWVHHDGRLVLLCDGSRESLALLRRLNWLRHLGFLRCSLAVADLGLHPEDREQIRRNGTVVWTSAVIAEMELERE